ncbi:hypothetical protein [Oerskovia enterophila]|uniref:Uncharacterized protein n=1 Tax=Oerskovia enterophila TaxID=43678 RepID=A0A163QUT2_9CELL|nr:hypothetical protein [Oerskovia enterophila]KZM34554.1 hypothetical protein OJAG_28530 [Oerskovia enterophila]
MATSPRKHAVPAPGETPRRQVINDLAASINDFVPVANVTERAQLLADLAAQNPPFVPSPARPLLVYRADAPAPNRLEVNDGAGFRPVAPVGGTFVGTLNQFGQIAIPHGLDYVPTMASVVMSLDLASGTIGEDIPRDYVATVYTITAVEIRARITNIRVSTWAGNGLRVALAWTAR